MIVISGHGGEEGGLAGVGTTAKSTRIQGKCSSLLPILSHITEPGINISLQERRPDRCVDQQAGLYTTSMEFAWQASTNETKFVAVETSEYLF